MRIWHEDLIPKLCRQHLLAQWREGLACHSIIRDNKKGYKNHPQVKMYKNNLFALWMNLAATRFEMVSRGYRPKGLPKNPKNLSAFGPLYEWQTLEEQIEILRKKDCDCKV